MNLEYDPSSDIYQLIREAIANLSPKAKKIYSINSKPQHFNHTDRIKDLNALNELDSSFILYSITKNGTTTLLKQFSQQNNFEYTSEDEIDSRGNDLIPKLNKINAIPNAGLIVDEGSISFEKAFKEELNLTDLLNSYIEASKQKKIGIRVHKELVDIHVLNKLIENGFILYDLGNIEHDDFLNGIKERYREFANSIPSYVIKDALDSYDHLHLSHSYVNTSFALLQFKPNFIIDKQKMFNYLINRKIQLENLTHRNMKQI